MDRQRLDSGLRLARNEPSSRAMKEVYLVGLYAFITER